jgi:hypothetical protein
MRVGSMRVGSMRVGMRVGMGVGMMMMKRIEIEGGKWRDDESIE